MAATLPFYLGETMDRWMDDSGERRFKDSSLRIDYDSKKHYKRPDAKREREDFVGLQDKLRKLEKFETTQHKKLYRDETEELKGLIREDTQLILQGEMHNLRWLAMDILFDPTDPKKFIDPEKVNDLIAVGVEWMIHSMSKFDLDKGNRFWTFTKKIIRLKMIGALTKPAKLKNITIIRYSETYDLEEPENMGTAYRPLPARYYDSLTGETYLRPARENRFQILKRISEFPHYDPKIDMERLLYRAILTDDERKVLLYFYQSGKKKYRIKDVAEILGMSTTQVHDLRKSGEAEMKRVISLDRQYNTEKRILRRHLIQWNKLLDYFGDDNILEHNLIYQIQRKDKTRGTKEFKKFIDGLTKEEQECYYDMRALQPFIKDGIEAIEKLKERYKERGK